jgi:hypothetical protein
VRQLGVLAMQRYQGSVHFVLRVAAVAAEHDRRQASSWRDLDNARTSAASATGYTPQRRHPRFASLLLVHLCDSRARQANDYVDPKSAQTRAMLLSSVVMGKSVTLTITDKTLTKVGRTCGVYFLYFADECGSHPAMRIRL